MSKSYTEMVSLAREAARDLLRAKWINGCRSVINRLNTDVAFDEREIAIWNKRIAIADYKVSKLDEADPEYDDKLKALKGDKEYYTTTLVTMNKRLADLNKRIDNENAFIATIESGEKKVNADELENEASRLLSEMVKATTVEAAKE